MTDTKTDTEKPKPEAKPSLDDLVQEHSQERKMDVAWAKAGQPETLDAWRQRWIRLVIVPREKAKLDQQLASKEITQQQYEKRCKALVK